MNAFEQKLRACGLRFEVNDENVASGTMSGLDDGRSHMFMIDLDGDTFGGRVEHDLMMRLGPAKDAKKVAQACTIAGNFGRGGIVVHQGHAFMKIELPAEIEPAGLGFEIAMMCTAADHLENIVWDSDDA